jgi:hypothetical protein
MPGRSLAGQVVADLLGRQAEPFQVPTIALLGESESHISISREKIPE